MSSSSSATTLNRSRSLRQPTAGLNRTQRKDDPGKDINNKDATAPNPAPHAARTTSPTRLPKPGGSTITSRPRAGTVGAGNGIPSTTTANPSAAGTRPRPVSGVFGRLSTVAVRKPVTQSTTNDPAEPANTTRPTALRTTRLTRPTSKSISTPAKPSPTAPSHPPSSEAAGNFPTRTQPPRTDAHTRAKSNVTALSSATALRPPRPPSAGSIASTSTATTAATAAGKRTVARFNTVAVRSAHQRQVSGSSPANTSGLSRSSTTAAARPRPAFSALQQRYSPARSLAPKPLTSTFLAPPTPSRLPANVAASSETARLQAELLQLHLLHRDADAVAAEWHASARGRLGSRFAELAGASAEAGEDEAEAEEARNLAALEAWGGGRALEDKIQILDSIISSVWSLGEPGGRYARVVRKFEKWVDRMVKSVEARRTAGGLGALMEDDKVAFVGELEQAWKDEVASMARKLDLWRRQLGQLGDGSPGGGDDEEKQKSSLARILSGCRGQVCDMLAELSVMEHIERDAISQETAWIRRMNRDDDENDTPKAGAIWRAL